MTLLRQLKERAIGQYGSQSSLAWMPSSADSFLIFLVLAQNVLMQEITMRLLKEIPDKPILYKFQSKTVCKMSESQKAVQKLFGTHSFYTQFNI